MINKRLALAICILIVLGLFVNNLLPTNRQIIAGDLQERCLSSIVGSQIARIVVLIEATKAENSQYSAARVQYLEAKKDKIINIWQSADLNLILTNLPDDLKELALRAKPDFATPVLDTRNANEQPA